MMPAQTHRVPSVPARQIPHINHILKPVTSKEGRLMNTLTLAGSTARRLIQALCAALALTLLLVLTGCGSTASTTDGAKSNNGKKTVLTTFTVLADIARNVAGDDLNVESLTKPGAEIHEYEPTPSDLKKAHAADLVLDNGLNLESWFTKFVKDSNAKHVTVSEGVTPISITEDAYAGKPNPHAWMSPSNVQKYVDVMIREFSTLDPTHAADYKNRGEAYKKQLQSVRDELVKEISTLPENQRALVTCEGAFSYLAADAGLKEKYIWAVNSEQQATPSQISSVIDYVRQNRVPAVFCESTVSDNPMRQVADATGARFGGVLYVDSLSEANGPVPTYLDMIRYDARTIVAGLKGERKK